MRRPAAGTAGIAARLPGMRRALAGLAAAAALAADRIIQLRP
jgi:hypothetical protein